MPRWVDEAVNEYAKRFGRDVAYTLKQKAKMMLRLSSLTLPHGMVRVLLTEQLYRAVSILHNHPYHRE